MTGRSTGVEAYLAGLPAEFRATLEDLREKIKAHVPDAVELISYGLPAFKYNGKPLVYLGAARNHCALYALDTSDAALAGFDTSKGTIRFPPGRPPPEDLVKRLLDKRLAAIDRPASRRRGAVKEG